MPRRTRASNTDAPLATSPPPPQQDAEAQNLSLLRRQWKWAAFSQFFCTFSPLFAMNDITVSDIERDLVNQTKTVIPRIMQRLLYTLSYDRKVTLDNWQSALRKQYMKRDPSSNPLGPEPTDAKAHAKGEFADDQPAPLVKADAIEKFRGEVDDEYTSEQSSATRQSSPADIAQKTDSCFDHAKDSHPVSSSNVRNSNSEDREMGQQISIDWFSLPMVIKLESMHSLVEWQFQNVTRLRTIMKSDDEFASWRVEPIGYDSKSNAYWFIGGDRLWIQRVSPKPPKSRTLKRKRKIDAHNSTSPKSTSVAKRPKLGSDSSALDHNDPSSSAPRPGRQSRAAKDQAKLRLDLQAKELAKLNQEASILERDSRSRRVSSKSHFPSRIIGTRTSARLRGTQDSEWQPIPDEWLDTETAAYHSSKTTISKTGLESDQETVSDLTELSSEADDTGNSQSPTQKKAIKNNVPHPDGYQSDAEGTMKQAKSSPSDFVEWETICVTLHDWEHVAERFEKATHYAEKALYKVLVNEIVPAVTQELREIQRKRDLEAALVQRKRSSRIALKESEREEARLAAKRKQEEEEKQSRARRLEARLQKEEAERIKRENAREQRRKEREAREEARKASSTPEVEGEGEYSNKEGMAPASAVPTKGQGARNKRPRQHASDDWELSCDICQRHGRNLDDGTPMMSCGRCSKWQHILCHDRADQLAGRPPRNWDSVDFICKSCRTSPSERHLVYNGQPFTPAERHSAMYATQPSSSRPYQQSVVPYANREQPYAPASRDLNQSFYIRPSAGQPMTQSFHPGVASNAPRSTISFSHYQPAAHNFSGQKFYSESHSHYNQPISQFRAVPQPNGTQAYSAMWNSSAAMQNSGYSYSQNGYAISQNPVHTRALQGDRPVVDQAAQALHNYPQTYYPPNQYLTNQFKHHPQPYQSSSDRQQ